MSTIDGVIRALNIGIQADVAIILKPAEAKIILQQIKKKPKVVIEVMGGIAYKNNKASDPDVEVEIIDYDNEEEN